MITNIHYYIVYMKAVDDNREKMIIDPDVTVNLLGNSFSCLGCKLIISQSICLPYSFGSCLILL